MSAYTSRLLKQVADQRMQQQAAPSPAETLRQKHDAWFASLPPASKHRHWSIDEIASALMIAPRELSQTLLDAGWLRKRVWFERKKGQGRYLRIWTPPQENPKKQT
ncbi:hypothetical protein [Ectopseudomonas toyotomiensis]|uniref:Helix-turn-helix domain-containing protein n=1 Tax=Ectopseudomonas toyotomiensis TaxID=554344 RepID=A0A1I5W088_9GAMM|nr:hypothetical protein [Pseudomonas toyotomiensis]SFQ13164.1 hypothetical protein SAMN05216177_10854 [Pseudomonas toyotomiensis]